MKLGWRNPRANTLQGPDAQPLKDLFGDLQKFLTLPHVGLVRSTAMDLTGTLAAVPWSPYPSTAAPFVAGDPYGLWPASNPFLQIRVPHTFQTWLALGVVGWAISGGAGTPLRTVAWRVNGTNTQFLDQRQRGAAGGATGTTSFIRPVRSSDTIDVAVASSDSTDDLTGAEAWIVFLPLS